MEKSIPRKALVAELIQLKEKTSWSWETISRELQRVMGTTGPSKTTLLRYATGKVKRRNLMVERYIQEAINKLKMKLVEEQLAKSEARFRELVENAKDLIYRYRLKPTRGFEYISPICKEMLGYTPEEFYADPKLVLKVVHPDDRKRLEQFLHTAEEVIGQTTEILYPAGKPGLYSELIERLMKGEQVTYPDTVRIRKDGQRIHVSLDISPVKNQEGQIIGFAGIAHDITASVRAEEELQESEQLFRQIAVNIQEVFFVVDHKDYRVLYVSPSYEKVWGQTCESLLKDPTAWIEAIIPEDRERVIAALENQQRTGKFNEEFRIVRPDKSIRWIHDRVFPIRNAQGEIYRLVGIALDISKRKQAEEKLQKSEQRYHDLFEKAPDMMAVVQYPSGKILECNQTLADELGRSKEKIVGRSWLDLYTPDSQEVAQETFDAFAKTGTILWKERTLLSADGNTIPVLVQAVPIPDATGKVVATQVTWRGISDLKETQKALEQKQEELFASQKMETIGTLAGGVAHDFNNLLTGIRGYTQLLLERMEPGSAESQDLLEILKCTDRATDLTRGLLTFSRRDVCNPIVLNLNSMIEDTCKIMERLIGENIEIEFVPGTDLDNIRADPGQIEQVLLNLAINARDAMPDGGSLKITTTNVTVDPDQIGKDVGVKAGRYVALFETDSGCGMDEMTRQRIFEPFFTTKDVGSGTGLGLSVVYGIVKEHEGYVWVNSQPGWGTTFTIYLPSTDEEVEELSPKDTPESMPKGSEVILVAEDEPPVRKLVKQVLEQLGYTVLSADHAQRAEELLNAHDGEIDLLLSDVIMPGENGPALYDRIRVQHPSLKVLYMSGYAETSDGLGSGTPFLSKPFTNEILAQKVREVLDSKKTSRIRKQ